MQKASKSTYKYGIYNLIESVNRSEETEDNEKTHRYYDLLSRMMLSSIFTRVSDCQSLSF